MILGNFANEGAGMGGGLSMLIRWVKAWHP